MDVSLDLKKKIAIWQFELEKRAEIGWQEFQTQAYIEKELGKAKWKEKTALVYGIGEGVPVFFRAELDGLPTEKGIQHACGHSAHLSALMAAYLYFKNNPVSGFKIYFVFQPAEETYPSGADFLVNRFTFLQKAKLGIAFHLFPFNQKYALIDPIFASADYFRIRLLGNGTHIKNKYQTTVDMVFEASQLALKINSIKNKKGLINVGVLRAGEVANRIAGEGLLEGDIRSFTELVRDRLKKRLDELVREVEKKGITVEYYFNRGYPMLKNEQRIIKQVKKILPLSAYSLSSYASEDFSLFPGDTLFLLVGTGSTVELHDSHFRVSTDLAETIFDYWLQVGANLSKITI
jgi:amidohydrolase